jgi:putative membrane protein
MDKRIAAAAAVTSVALAAGGGSALGLGTATASASATSGLDEQYLATSVEGDVFEIKGGKIALGKSSNPKVRRLARVLVHDHRKSLAETKRLAEALGVKVENHPSPSQAWELAILKRKSGTDFDSSYAHLETSDHKQDISDATMEIHRGFNSSVIASARKELPMLRWHLKLSRAALK